MDSHSACCDALLVLGLMLPIFPSQGYCATVDTAAISQLQLQTLADWTASKMGIIPFTTLPEVEVLSAEQLTALRYGKSMVEPPSVVALYDPNSHVIFVLDNLDASTAVGQSALVHELVHHFQIAEGRKFPCAQAMEEEALALQNLYLGLFGTNIEKEFGIDPFTQRVFSNCPY